MADEVSRWASARAPDLRRRAEEEAVALLRDSLLRAAIGERPVGAARDTASPPAPAPRRSSETSDRPSGDVLWTYCVVRAEAPVPDRLAGIDGEGRVERVVEGDVAALVSPVPAREFGAEPLRANLNDIRWLERVARAHEEIQERALAAATIVPLRLCTLYEDEDGVRRMLSSEHDALTAALDYLDGRQEWGVKVLVDPGTLEREAARDSSETVDREDDIAGTTAGAAYMVRRRRAREVRELADALAAKMVTDVHESLSDCTVDAVTRPPQNRDLSEHDGEMLLNAAYLVEASRADALRELVGELEGRHRTLGARLELTGPWPAYNFVPESGAGGIA